ncbi:MAG: hypothetical protein IPJ19_18535 [Planctomycetes bacterium]|nr:hypothetical protein [Planctomycetota bacterium]
MLVSLFLAALLAPVSSARAPAPAAAPRLRADDALVKARAELVQGLLALAVWANKSELFLQRDKLWRAVIGIEPDNTQARKGLRCTRDGAGHWKDPPVHDLKDRKPAALPEFARRRSEVVAAWRKEVLAQLETEKADAAQREKACADLLELDPEDEIVHGLRGEVHVGKDWRLAEAMSAEARRTELETCARAARDAAPAAESTTPSAQDLAYLPAWKFARVGDGIRILSQTGEDEARALGSAGHAALALLQEVCGKPLVPSPGFSLYVLADESDGDAFVKNVAESTAEDHRIWRLAPGFGIPRRAAVAVWDKDPRRRLDCFTRHLVANCLFTGYGVDARQGWVLDGLGLYLTQRLAGTHATWFRPDRNDEDLALRKRLATEDCDWLAQARELVHDRHAPKLDVVVQRPLAELRLEELLLAYAFAAYLAEGQPKALPEILDRMGRGGAPTDTIAAVTGRSFAEVEARFLRWLAEVH